MTRHIDRLVDKGHIERISSENDRRQVVVRLTASGREMREQLKRCEMNLSHQVLQAIPADQWETVMSGLKLLLNAIAYLSRNRESKNLILSPKTGDKPLRHQATKIK